MLSSKSDNAIVFSMKFYIGKVGFRRILETHLQTSWKSGRKSEYSLFSGKIALTSQRVDEIKICQRHRVQLEILRKKRWFPANFGDTPSDKLEVWQKKRIFAFFRKNRSNFAESWWNQNLPTPSCSAWNSASEKARIGDFFSKFHLNKLQRCRKTPTP